MSAWRTIVTSALIALGAITAFTLAIMYLTGFRLWADPNAPVREYANCAEVEAAGVEPLWRHEPGYEPRHDADGDGRGCDPDGFGGWTKVIARDFNNLFKGD